jgi:hypothetical protein
MSVGYIIKYTPRNSVGHRPEIDHQIGVDNGMIGCGRVLHDEKAFSLEWFTLINGRLYYHGKPTRRVEEDEDPWQALGGRLWTSKFYVRYHLDLGLFTDVLAHLGIDSPAEMNIKAMNVFMADWPASHRLIAYAQAVAEGGDAEAAPAAAAVAAPAASPVDALLRDLARLSAEVDEIYAELASRLAMGV